MSLSSQRPMYTGSVLRTEQLIESEVEESLLVIKAGDAAGGLHR